MKRTASLSLPELIISVMEPDSWYGTKDIAEALGLKAADIYKEVQALEKAGRLTAKRTGQTKLVQLRSSSTIAGPTYMAPMKPLTGYNLSALQRLCEGARHSETGMA
ncbi:hypothetical protein ACIPEN_22325 [Herbaspirillum chlorophenolicum]|uniref:Uncharacterized protein n=1 Tax=Herbaspirillum chlorophenolicum TaxID=211589 RepID=A0ABW8F5K1_9BURK